jgi:hypothetical protein
MRRKESKKALGDYDSSTNLKRFEKSEDPSHQLLSSLKKSSSKRDLIPAPE